MAWYHIIHIAHLDEIFSDHTVLRLLFVYILHVHPNNYYWQLWLFVVTYFNTYYHYTIISQFYLL
jgi:hypothetical protein